MEWRVRQRIEDVLWQVARDTLGAGPLDRKRLLRAIADRTQMYTTNREMLQKAPAPASAVDLAARALFFTVADAAKVSIPLSELAGRSLLPQGNSWRVLDLGAGAGAMGLGLISYLADYQPQVELQIEAVDMDAAALAIYKDAVQLLNKTETENPTGAVAIQTTVGSLGKISIRENAYDLVVMGSVLNEMSVSERTHLVEQAMGGLSPQGSLIIIEPALRETSRSLHELRSVLIQGGTSIFAPCTQSIAPCPALEDERDWCHEDHPVVLPSRTRQLAQTTGLRDGGMKFSYLVARHQADTLVDVSQGQVPLRVVSQPQKTKGQRECFVCGPGCGRQRMRLLKRNRNADNRIFERVRRGDVLVTDQISSATGRIDIAKNQTIVQFRPAQDYLS